MKNLILLALSVLLLTACNKQEETPQWEYMVMTYEGSKTPKVYGAGDAAQMEANSAFQTLRFFDSEEWATLLNNWGKDGWELVDTYTTNETVFPNFGEESHHTGVKSNTRTNTINFVFKRKAKK